MYEIACTLELFHILHRQIDSMVSTIILNIVSKKMDDLLFYTIYRFTIFKQFLCFIEIRIQYLATLNKKASLVWWRACLFKWGQSREAVYLYETELLKIYFAEWITVVNTLPVDLFLWCSCFWLAHRHYLQGYLTSSTKLAPLRPCDLWSLPVTSEFLNQPGKSWSAHFEFGPIQYIMEVASLDSSLTAAMLNTHCPWVQLNHKR
jgi:hypothetical protein